MGNLLFSQISDYVDTTKLGKKKGNPISHYWLAKTFFHILILVGWCTSLFVYCIICMSLLQPNTWYIMPRIARHLHEKEFSHTYFGEKRCIYSAKWLKKFQGRWIIRLSSVCLLTWRIGILWNKAREEKALLRSHQIPLVCGPAKTLRAEQHIPLLLGFARGALAVYVINLTAIWMQASGWNAFPTPTQKAPVAFPVMLSVLFDMGRWGITLSSCSSMAATFALLVVKLPQ